MFFFWAPTEPFQFTYPCPPARLGQAAPHAGIVCRLGFSQSTLIWHYNVRTVCHTIHNNVRTFCHRSSRTRPSSQPRICARPAQKSRKALPRMIVTKSASAPPPPSTGSLAVSLSGLNCHPIVTKFAGRSCSAHARASALHDARGATDKCADARWRWSGQRPLERLCTRTPRLSQDSLPFLTLPPIFHCPTC